MRDDYWHAAEPLELSRFVKAAAFLGVKLPQQALVCIGSALAEAVQVLPAKETARCAWALSRLGFCPPIFLSAIEAQVLEGSWLPRLDLDGQASLVWVCKRASHNSSGMLTALTKSIAHSAGNRCRSQSGGQAGRARHLSLALYCCASLRFTPPLGTLRQLCSAVRASMPGCSPQGLSYIAWSLSQMSHHDAALLSDLAVASLRKIQRFNCHELARLTSGFAGLNHPHPNLFQAAACAATTSTSYCSPRDLSHILSSLAKFGVHPGTDTLEVLEHHAVALLRQRGRPAQRAKRGKHGKEVVARGPAVMPAGGLQAEPAFPPGVLCWVLWSLVKLGHQPRALLRSAEEAWRRSPVLLYQLSPEDVGRLLWALGRLSYRAKFLSELELVLRRQLGSTPPQSLAMTLHGFATLGVTPHELLDGAVQHMAVHLHDYPPQSVASSVWSLAKMGVHPGRGLPEGGFRTQDGVPLMTALEEFAVQHAEQLNAQAISMLCWGLATLQHHPGYAFLDTMAASLARQAQAQQQQLGGQKAGAAEGSSQGLHTGLDASAKGGSPPLQALSLVAWAFAQWSHPDERLHTAVRACLLGGSVQDSAQDSPLERETQGQSLTGRGAAAPASISNIAFALAKLGVRDAELVVALRLVAEHSLDEYNAQELVNLLWCHAALGVQPPLGFLEAATAALGRRMQSCNASLVALVVHSMAILRYAPPDDWLEAAVQCVAAAVQEGLDDDPTGLDSGPHSMPSSGKTAPGPVAQQAEQGRRAPGTRVARTTSDTGEPWEEGPSASNASAITGEQASSSVQLGGEGGPLLFLMEHGSRGGRQRQLRRNSTGVHVSLICKLLWGCAELGYQPPSHLLSPIVDSAHWGLSHNRGRGLVLPAPEKVRLLWALAILEQYGTSLYRNMSFQVSRLPRGVPRDPASVQLLRQVVMLSNCEARFITVPLRGSTLLPEWIRDAVDGGGALSQEQDTAAGDVVVQEPAGADGNQAVRVMRRGHQQEVQQEEQAVAPQHAGARAAEPAPSISRVQAVATGTAGLQRPQWQQGILEAGSSNQSGAGLGGVQQRGYLLEQLAQAQEKEGRQEAEELAQALRAAGCKPVAVRQLLFGDWVVVYRFRDSGQSALIPWLPHQRAVNNKRRLVGSSQATLRVLAAKGLPVVLGQHEVQGTVKECLDLWT